MSAQTTTAVCIHARSDKNGAASHSESRTASQSGKIRSHTEKSGALIGRHEAFQLPLCSPKPAAAVLLRMHQVRQRQLLYHTNYLPRGDWVHWFLDHSFSASPRHLFTVGLPPITARRAAARPAGIEQPLHGIYYPQW